MNPKIVLSVHGLVDFLLRKGDIDNRVYNSSSMLEGTRIHLRYQQIQKGNYLSEQYLSASLEIEGYTFELSGRADGIIVGGAQPIIDEIKSTVSELETFYESQKEWHLGQAQVYAYMYCKENGLDACGIRLTYISQQDNKDKLILNFSFTFDQLEERVRRLCEEYLHFYRKIDAHNEARTLSSRNLEFPFEQYRPGQRDMARYVYGSILNRKPTFIEAPTGIGKTISTLFPAVKSFSTLGVEKIFYLSSKNVIKEVAYSTCRILSENGLIARVIKLTAKEKMCRVDSRKCNPDECPFTKGYYDKLKAVIDETISSHLLLDEDKINLLADEHEMCPFELQLDLSLFCDIIICDYNYLFDPIAYLRRFFDQEKVPYVALIDEAHNLVDRSKEMYSAILDSKSFKELRFHLKKAKLPKMKKLLRKIVGYLDERLEAHADFVPAEKDFSAEFYSMLDNLYTQCQDILKNHPESVDDVFLDVHRKVFRFAKIGEFVSAGFHTYFDCQGGEVKAIIRCLDSSDLIRTTLDKLTTGIFFSATLSPLDYYVHCLGGDDETPKLILPSPFDKTHLLSVVRDDVSTRYVDRSFSYETIARTIESVVKAEKGNYLVFFPSYRYLEDVFAYLPSDSEAQYIRQTRDMVEKEKQNFLNRFKMSPDNSTVGLAVLGGAFSEGIDLVSTRLIGAIIVGVGLPTVSYERNIIKDYFSGIGKNGFDYAYLYPGINKVMQAAGRVIRSESDYGIVLFIDSRYGTYKYRSLLKEQYRNARYAEDDEELIELVRRFWERKKSEN